ncbi:hypothetical protein BU15DRAFT_56036, partial [Melanogaster broomeanus]
NCLVAMRPNTSKADLPSTHDISTYIHNSFIEFLSTLKTRIQVCLMFVLIFNDY